MARELPSFLLEAHMLNDPDPNLHEKHETDERWDTVGRRHRAFGIAGVILTLTVIGLAVLAWIAYPELKRHEATLTSFAGVQQVVGGLGDHMKEADSKIKEVDSKIAGWASDRQALSGRITKLGERIEARLEAVRMQAQEASAETLRRVQAQIDGQAQAVETRLAHLESAREGDQARVADLQRELNQVRGELVKQAGELNTVRGEIEDTGASHERQFASLKEREERGQREVAAIEHRLAVRRVDFEVNKNHSRELAEGISLDVTGTDVLYRKVSGWMWILPDRRTIWLKGHGAQEPVVFYGYNDGKKRELVITNVTKNSVAGYLLLPADAPATTQTAFVHSSE